MAKSKATGFCIFCGEEPCGCDPKKTKKKPTPREPTDFKTVEVERDLTMEAAIRALEPLLASSERQVYSRVLRPPLSGDLERRILDWRHRGEVV